MPYTGTPEERRAKAAAASRRWREKPENLEKSRKAARESIARRRQRDPEFAERQRQAAAKWRAEHLDEVRKAGWSRNHRAANLKKLYSMSVGQYEAKLAEQGGVCAICSCLPDGVGRNGKFLHVDHDHATERVRGLLCRACNTALERVVAVPNFGELAGAYLASYTANER